MRPDSSSYKNTHKVGGIQLPRFGGVKWTFYGPDVLNAVFYICNVSMNLSMNKYFVMSEENSQQLISQRDLLEQYSEYHPNENEVAIEYYDSYGRFPCLRVTSEQFEFEMEYRPLDNIFKSEIHTRIYYLYTDKNGNEIPKSFMMKRGIVPPEYGVFTKVRSDYHYLSVSYSDWAIKMIEMVELIRKDQLFFLHLCNCSCPYNEDGSHKYHSWKNYAKVRIVYKQDSPLLQGFKQGEVPVGSHVAGGNGTYRVFNKGEYGLQYVVEKLAGEKPKRGDPRFIPFDDYLRNLRDKLGYKRNMPYAKLNAMLPKRVEVITYDMNIDPEQRDFVPVNYNGSWQIFIQECLNV